MHSNDPKENLNNKKEQLFHLLETKRLFPEYRENEKANINLLLKERDMIFDYYADNIGNENRHIAETCIDALLSVEYKIKKYLQL